MAALPVIWALLASAQLLKAQQPIRQHSASILQACLFLGQSLLVHSCWAHRRCRSAVLSSITAGSLTYQGSVNSSR